MASECLRIMGPSGASADGVYGASTTSDQRLGQCRKKYLDVKKVEYTLENGTPPGCFHLPDTLAAWGGRGDLNGQRYGHVDLTVI